MSQRDAMPYSSTTRLALVLVASLGLCGLARAEGNGIKMGDARLHVYAEIESWYDSAATLVNGSSTNSYQTAGDLLFHFRPGLKLDVPSSIFALNLNGNVDYVLYTGVINSGTRSNSHLNADADLDMNINRDGQFAVDIGDHVTRSDNNISTPALAIGYLSLYNDARLKLSIRPYNGSITIEPGYQFATEIFTSLSGIDVCPGGNTPECTASGIDQYNYFNHTVSLNGRWKFMPKTALVLDSSFGIRTYINTGASTGIMSLKAMLGVAGLLTTHWEIMLKVGWGQDFTEKSYSSVVGQAEVGYLLSETGSLRLGYVRTFEPTGGSYVSFGDDRVYLEGRVLLGGKITIHGTGGFDWLTFRPTQAHSALANASKSQYNVSLDVGVDYEIQFWVTIGAGYRLTYLTSDQPVFVGLTTFVRNEGYLKLQFIY